MQPAGRSSSPLLYQGDLAQTPLPEILITIHRHKAPGVVECRRGDEAKRIYLDRGNIIFAATNRLSESLGDMLLRQGRISREQYDESVRRLRETKKRHGVVLLEMNAITSEELFLAVRTHIEEIVFSIFAWSSGSVTFTPGREKHLEFVKVEIPVPQAVLRGVRRMTDARALIARVGTKTTLLERTGRSVDGLALAAEEQGLLEAVDGMRGLGELTALPPLAPGENARILYALHALQLIGPKRHVKVQLRTGKQPAG